MRDGDLRRFVRNTRVAYIPHRAFRDVSLMSFASLLGHFIRLGLKLKKPAWRDYPKINFVEIMMLGMHCLCRSVRFEVDKSAIIDVVCDCRACKVVPPNHAESWIVRFMEGQTRQTWFFRWRIWNCLTKTGCCASSQGQCKEKSLFNSGTVTVVPQPCSILLRRSWSCILCWL